MLRLNVTSPTSWIKALLLFSLFPVPAWAWDTEPSFIALHLAFALGVILSFCIYIAYQSARSRINKILLGLVIFSLAILLLSVAIFRSNTELVITSATGYVLFGFLWLREQLAIKNDKTITSLCYGCVLVSIALLVNLVLNWLAIPLSWLLYTIILSLCFLIALYRAMSAMQRVERRRIHAVLFTVFSSMIFIYLWLIQLASQTLLLAWLVVSLLVLLEYNYWHAAHLITSAQLNSDENKTNVDSVTYDAVTNLPIYHCALSVFEHYLLQHRQAHCVAIVFKPTNFQQVNSILGHKNSDMLLLQLSYCLQQAVAQDQRLLNFAHQQYDEHVTAVRIARLQGLHFLIVLNFQENKHPEQSVIEQLCADLASAVPKAMNFKSFSLHFKLAFGIAYLTQGSGSASEAIACAEDALLIGSAEQKEVNYFQEHYAVFNQKQLQRMEQLKHDIQHDGMHWFIQPQVAIANKELIGFELIGFWPSREQEMPLNCASIVTLAEQSGDIYALTKLQLYHVFGYINKLKELGFELPITVKLTSLNVLEFELVELIDQQIQQHDIAPCRLILEIKESLLFSAPQQAQKIIAQLKANGVKIAIGDFSGSYEALRYLRRLAIDQVKIDCNQLASEQVTNSDKAIINALINLTRTMDLPIIATEVNNLVTEDALVNMGAPFLQGKLYHAGLDLDNLSEWLIAWHKQYGE